MENIQNITGTATPSDGGNTAPADSGGNANANENSTLDSVDDIVDVLSEDTPSSDDTGSGIEGGEPGDTASSPENTPGSADIPMPEGMKAEQWNNLTPEMKGLLNDREVAHARAISAERQNSIQAQQVRDAHMAQANAAYQQVMGLLNEVTQAEFGGIDWNGLAQRDPATYVQYRQQYETRMNAIRTLQENAAQVANQYRQQKAAEYQQGIMNELRMVEPSLKAMIGAGYNSQKFAEACYGYLKSCGFDDRSINSISKGSELTLVAKAMMYDRGARLRASAAQKIREAPQINVHGSERGEGMSSPATRSAMKAFKANPNSTEALANLLENY